MYKYYDKKNNFVETFNPETGFYIRSDDLTTGKEPFMRDFPALLDIGVMGHCVHGASGLCIQSGVQCYQNGLHTQEPNMSLVVKHIEGYYEEDTDYWKKGDYWEDYVLEVVGHGINKVTGKPINFVGKQTGL